MQSPELAVQELRRCVRELGLAGVEVCARRVVRLFVVLVLSVSSLIALDTLLSLLSGQRLARDVRPPRVSADRLTRQRHDAGGSRAVPHISGGRGAWRVHLRAPLGHGVVAADEEVLAALVRGPSVQPSLAWVAACIVLRPHRCVVPLVPSHCG